MKSRMNGFLLDDRGQDLTEYTLLIACILLVILGVANGIHNSVAGIVSVTNTNLAKAASGASP